MGQTDRPTIGLLELLRAANNQGYNNKIFLLGDSASFTQKEQDFPVSTIRQNRVFDRPGVAGAVIQSHSLIN